jgi:hypothetical protein
MDILTQLAAVSGGKTVAMLLAVLLLAVVVSGIIVSIKQGQFRLSAVGEFLGTKALPLVGGYYVVCFVAAVIPEWRTEIVGAALIAVTGTFLGLISANLKELGIPMPDAIGGRKPPA